MTRQASGDRDVPLFMSEGHRQAADFLVAAFAGGPHLAILTGEPGCGKTLLIRACLKNLDSTHAPPVWLKTVNGSVDILRQLLRQCGVPYRRLEHRQALLSRFAQFLEDEVDANQGLTLVLDQANAPPKVVFNPLMEIITLSDALKVNLRVIVIGRPELEQSLGQVGKVWRHGTVVSHRLSHLRADEIEAYLAHRLGVTSKPFQLQAEAVKQIGLICNGNPAKIRQLLHHALQVANLSRATTLTPAMVATGAARLAQVHRLRRQTNQHAQQARTLLQIALALLLGVLLSTPLQQANERTATRWPDPEPSPTAAIHSQNPTRKDSFKQEDIVTQNDPATLPVKPSPVISNRWLSDLEGLGSDQPHRPEHQMFMAWIPELEPSGRVDCQSADNYGLDCVDYEGDWTTLRNLNLPVMLDLSNGQGTHFFIFVRREAKGIATVALDGKTQSMPTSELLKRWSGHAKVLWRPVSQEKSATGLTLRDPASATLLSQIRTGMVSGSYPQLDDHEDTPLECRPDM